MPQEKQIYTQKEQNRNYINTEMLPGESIEPHNHVHSISESTIQNKPSKTGHPPFHSEDFF